MQRVFVAFQTGGFSCGTPARQCDAGDYLLSVSARRPKHLSLYSPTGDPSKPGTGTTHLFYGGRSLPGTTFGRPDQSSTRRNRRFTLIACDLPFAFVATQSKLVLPGEAESGSA